MWALSNLLLSCRGYAHVVGILLLLSQPFFQSADGRLTKYFFSNLFSSDIINILLSLRSTWWQHFNEWKSLVHRVSSLGLVRRCGWIANENKARIELPKSIVVLAKAQMLNDHRANVNHLLVRIFEWMNVSVKYFVRELSPWNYSAAVNIGINKIGRASCRERV